MPYQVLSFHIEVPEEYSLTIVTLPLKHLVLRGIKSCTPAPHGTVLGDRVCLCILSGKQLWQLLVNEYLLFWIGFQCVSWSGTFRIITLSANSRWLSAVVALRLWDQAGINDDSSEQTQ